MASGAASDVTLDGTKKGTFQSYLQGRSRHDNVDLTSDAYYIHAECYMKLDRYEEALFSAKKSVEVDPESIKGYGRLLEIAIALGNIREADIALKILSLLDPTNELLKPAFEKIENVRKLIPLVQKGMGDENFFEACSENIYKLSEICPHCVLYKLLKGECLARSGKYKEAISLMHSVLEFDLMNVSAKYILAICLYHFDLNEALNCLANILSIDPYHLRAQNSYKLFKTIIDKKLEGKKAFERADYQKAHEIYFEAMALDPNHIKLREEMYYRMAQASYKMDNLEKSIEECTKALETYPDFVEALVRRGKCYIETNDYEKAMEDLLKAYEIDSGYDCRNALDEAILKKSRMHDDDSESEGIELFK